MASGLTTLHGEAFYGKVEASMESLLAELEATTATASAVMAKDGLPNWFHCMVGVIGWVASWGCFVAGCATVVACFACAAFHVAVTTTMVDTCSRHRSEIIRE